MAESNFIDFVRIFCASGHGGAGSAHLHRAKYVPKGGPDGGDGGRGGHIILRVNPQLWTLIHLRYRKVVRAEGGGNGQEALKRGKNGADIVLEVPCGVVVKDAETEEVITELVEPGQEYILCRGGKGGLGNQHFATSTMQAPKYAQPGGECIELEVLLELKVLADVGLVGFPNAGKSTLLSRLSNAKPEIASYPFTTLHPILGVVDIGEGRGFVMADIPGLIEGASEGVGLGHQFLRHIERTKVLVHMVDGASVDGRNPVDDVIAIQKELSNYSEVLTKKPQIIAVNKLDAIPDQKDEILNELKDKFESEGVKVMPISAVTGEGIKELVHEIADILSNFDDKPIVYEQEYDPQEHLFENETFTVTKSEEEEGVYLVEGPKIEKMLGYTNMESEKGFLFFQRFMKEQGILKELEQLGIQDGDTVRLYSLEFEYYK